MYISILTSSGLIMTACRPTGPRLHAWRKSGHVIFICICIYVYIHIHIYGWIYIYVHIHTYIYIQIYIYIYLYIFVYMYSHIYTDIYLIHRYIFTHMYMNIYIYNYTYTRTSIYIYTHRLCAPVLVSRLVRALIRGSRVSMQLIVRKLKSHLQTPIQPQPFFRDVL